MEKYSIGFFGDFTTGENYQQKAEALERTNVLRQYGYDWLFEKVKPVISKFDMNIFNLETPLTRRTRSFLHGIKPCVHWADPEIVPKLLKKYNVEAVSLGNNHGMDYEISGLEDSFRALEAQNISHFGAGLNSLEAKEPYKKEIKIKKESINLYVLGGYKYREDYEKNFKFYADDSKGGVNLLTPEKASPVIKAIKARDKKAYIVAFPHFGFDLLKTTKLQNDYARSFIDAGADIVIGHGPHMINSIEKYKKKTILYGIGNFIFPTNFRGKPIPYNTVVELVFELSKQGKIEAKTYLYPTYMNNQSYSAQTRFITKSEVDEFVTLLLENSNVKKSSLDIEVKKDFVKIGV